MHLVLRISISDLLTSNPLGYQLSCVPLLLLIQGVIISYINGLQSCPDAEQPGVQLHFIYFKVREEIRVCIVPDHLFYIAV